LPAAYWAISCWFWGYPYWWEAVRNGEQKFDRVHILNQTNLMFLANHCLDTAGSFLSVGQTAFCFGGIQLAVAVFF
jgi:hypothetical protein